MQPPAAFAGKFEVCAVLESLDRECAAYCLLGTYEDLPAVVSSDIDFMVGKGDFERLPAILSSVARRTGFRLVQEFQHETTARYYVLARSSPGRVEFLHPDSCSDYRRHGKTWFQPQTLFARRRKHSNGFWVPASADAFMYYLIKRIDKQSLDNRHGQQLSRWFSEDPQGCTAALSERLTPGSTQLIATAASTGNWVSITDAVRQLSGELLISAGREKLLARVQEWIRKTQRFLKPTGLFVAILGPDGSGKSSVVEQYLPALEPAFRRTQCFHLRPRLFRGSAHAQTTNTDPHGEEARGLLASSAKVLFLWIDYVLGYFFRVRPALVRSTLVIFDRYYYDLLIDPRRFRYAGPQWLARFVHNFIPKPDLILILDAPADVLQSRKKEVPARESARQASAYQALADSADLKDRTVLIDVTPALAQVVHECVDATLRHLEIRTARRIPLTNWRQHYP